MSSDETPFLAKLGAGEREGPAEVNLDVSGTVGPDYLGQQTTNVKGHPQDRPGVRNRRFDDADPEDSGRLSSRVLRMDTGEELPVLLSSSMSTDPIEGTQGSYTVIEEGHCPRCGYDRIRVTVNTLPGERRRRCNACEAIIDRGEWRMPPTKADRADRYRESAEKLGDAGRREVYANSGLGFALVKNDNVDRWRESELLEVLVRLCKGDRWGDVGPVLDRDVLLDELLDETTSGTLERTLVLKHLLPGFVELGFDRSYVSDEQMGELWDRFDEFGGDD